MRRYPGFGHNRPPTTFGPLPDFAELFEHLYPRPEDVHIFLGHSPEYRLECMLRDDTTEILLMEKVFNGVQHAAKWYICLHEVMWKKRYQPIELQERICKTRKFNRQCRDLGAEPPSDVKKNIARLNKVLDMTPRYKGRPEQLQDIAFVLIMWEVFRSMHPDKFFLKAWPISVRRPADSIELFKHWDDPETWQTEFQRFCNNWLKITDPHRLAPLDVEVFRRADYRYLRNGVAFEL